MVCRVETHEPMVCHTTRMISGSSHGGSVPMIATVVQSFQAFRAPDGRWFHSSGGVPFEFQPSMVELFGTELSSRLPQVARTLLGSSAPGSKASRISRQALKVPRFQSWQPLRFWREKHAPLPTQRLTLHGWWDMLGPGTVNGRDSWTVGITCQLRDLQTRSMGCDTHGLATHNFRVPRLHDWIVPTDYFRCFAWKSVHSMVQDADAFAARLFINTLPKASTSPT